MSPEAADYLAKARGYLIKAHHFVDVLDYPDEAGRAAYLAGFHAAQAFIFERTSRVVKTHSGLRTAFGQVAQDEPRLDRMSTRFLARAYKIKEVTDYGIGPQSIVTTAEARETIVAAEAFVERIGQILQ